MAAIGLPIQVRQIRQSEYVREVRQVGQSRSEKIDRLIRGGGAIGRRACIEVNFRLENGFRVLLFDKDESARERVVGDAFDANVSNCRAKLYRFYVRPAKHAARGISEQVRLPVALLDDDELAAADVGDAFGVIEFRALRAGAGG